MFQSLRSRLMLSYVVLVVVILITAGATLAIASFRADQRLAQSQLQAVMPLAMQRAAGLFAQGQTPQQVVEALEVAPDKEWARALVVVENNIEADSDNNAWVGQTGTEVLSQFGPGQFLPSTGYLNTANARYYYAAARLSEAPSRVLVILAPARLMQSFLAFGRPLLWATVMALIVGVALAWLISRSVSQPLQQIAAAAGRVGQGDLDLDLNVSGPREVVQLAAQFATMTREVKAAREAQREFIANVSHDLKTPLTSIRGFAQAISEGLMADDAERTQYSAQVILDESLRMGRMVDQLLDLARLDAGQMPLRFAAVDARAVLDGVISSMAMQAQSTGVELRAEGSPAVRAWADGDRLAQVFANLIENAIRHTPPGGSVNCTVQALPGSSPQVEIAIADTGAGIPAEDLPHVFDRFYQVDKARSKGTAGLGLAIVKEIVRAHGGDVSVSSVVGEGTVFRVRLPGAPD